MIASFVTYLIHYVLARTVYDALGGSRVLIAICAIAAAAIWWRRRHR